MSAYKDAQANNDITRNVKQYRDLDLFFGRKTNIAWDTKHKQQKAKTRRNITHLYTRQI